MPARCYMMMVIVEQNNSYKYSASYMALPVSAGVAASTCFLNFVLLLLILISMVSIMLELGDLSQIPTIIHCTCSMDLESWGTIGIPMIAGLQFFHFQQVSSSTQWQVSAVLSPQHLQLETATYNSSSTSTWSF